jgi:hypothetical protein
MGILTFDIKDICHKKIMKLQLICVLLGFLLLFSVSNGLQYSNESLLQLYHRNHSEERKIGVVFLNLGGPEKLEVK